MNLKEFIQDFADNHEIQQIDELDGIIKAYITKDIYLSYYKGSDKKHTDYTSYYEDSPNLGDVNEDGKITVADVMLLVKMVLGQ